MIYPNIKKAGDKTPALIVFTNRNQAKMPLPSKYSAI